MDSPDTTWFDTERDRQQWNVVLPIDPTLDLSIDADAPDSRLDPADAKLDGFELDAMPMRRRSIPPVRASRRWTSKPRPERHRSCSTTRVRSPAR